MNVRRDTLAFTAAVTLTFMLCACAASYSAAATSLSAVSLGGSAEGQRDVEPTVWFQGFLADAGTSEPINAVYDVSASIYSQEGGGSAIWGPELHTDVPIIEGWFNIELGSVVSPLPDFSSPPYYLELQVNGETLSPRSKLASVPTSRLSSETAHPDNDWTVDGGDVYRETGNVGIGTTSPGAALDVQGTVKTTAFQLTTGPASGRVLTSDASGNGSWQPLPGGIGGGGTAGYLTKFDTASTIGNSAVYESEGRVGIGTTTTTGGKLTVENSGLIPALSLRNTAASSAVTVQRMDKTLPLQVNDSMLDMWIPSNSTGGTFIRCLRTDMLGTSTPFYVTDRGRVYSTGGAQILDSQNPDAVSVTGYYESGDAKVIHASYEGGSYDAAAVFGESAPADWYGYGGWFEGGYTGVRGAVQATGNHLYYGVYGGASGGSGTCYGVAGGATGGGTNYAVYGFAALGTANWAGYFDGDVRVTGSLVNPAASLEIDDPTDPANGYLRHPYVASSEMKTVYDGTAVLDSKGEAWIEMPDWCEALNGDFRYQLTPIGGPAPNLYVADELTGGRFRIAGGEPDMKVCWMMTGVRRDASAASRASEVRVPKTGDDVGRYVDPEAYGVPVSEGIGAIRDEKLGR